MCFNTRKLLVAFCFGWWRKKPIPPTLSTGLCPSASLDVCVRIHLQTCWGCLLCYGIWKRIGNQLIGLFSLFCFKGKSNFLVDALLINYVRGKIGMGYSCYLSRSAQNCWELKHDFPAMYLQIHLWCGIVLFFAVLQLHFVLWRNRIRSLKTAIRYI